MLPGSGTMTFNAAAPPCRSSLRLRARFVDGPLTNYEGLQSIHVVMDDGQKT